MANVASGKPLGGIARAFAAMRGRLYQAPGATISTVDPQAWPSPLQPVQPTGPKGSQPLAYSYWNGINQEISPRSDLALSFSQLRDLATYPLARVCIENVKDILCSMQWKIQLKRIAGEPIADWKARQQKDNTVTKLTEFFQYPDGETPWADWWRPVIEDMLVVDAPSILVQRTLSGQVVKLRWTDGTQILRLIDDQGFTPQGDNPAYTQLWEGIPRILLTTGQLTYRPSNIVARNSYASKLYGMSITEQLAQEIEIGQDRLNFVQAYYRDGIDGGLKQVVPSGVSPDKVSENVQALNMLMSGNYGQRRKLNVIQGYHTSDDARPDQFIESKEPVLADVWDDVHIKKVCFGYGVSSQRLTKMLNRAGAEAGQDASEKEGIMPRLQWMKGTADCLIQRKMNQPDHELVFDTDDELDAVKQSEVSKTLISIGRLTIDEDRTDRGLVPFNLPETQGPIIILPTGVQPLEGSFDRVQQQMDNDTAQANKPAPQPVGVPKPGSDPQKKTLKSASKSSPVISGSKLSKRNLKFQIDMEHRINRWFQTTSNRIMDAIGDKFGTAVKMAKADSSDDDGLQTEVLLGGKKVPKLESDTIRAIALLAWKAVDWNSLVLELQPYIEEAVHEGIDIGTAQVEIENVARVAEAAKEAAQKYAADRSAELGGKRRVAVAPTAGTTPSTPSEAQTTGGELVDDPNAEWPLTDVMQRDLESTVAMAVDEAWTVEQLAAVIEASYALSSERAAVIANTELTNAQSFGTYTVWKESGVITMVHWRTSDLERQPDECDAFEAQGVVPLGHEFARGIRYPRAHPNCRCDLEVIDLGDEWPIQ